MGSLVGDVSPMGSASTWEGGVGSQAQNLSFLPQAGCPHSPTPQIPFSLALPPMKIVDALWWAPAFLRWPSSLRGLRHRPETIFLAHYPSVALDTLWEMLMNKCL